MIDKHEENIDNLASEANEIMAENKYYYKKLFLYEKYIAMTKDVITNLLSNNNIESAIECFDKYIEEIQKDYDNMNKLYEEKELPEYNNLMDNCFSEITMGKPILEKERNTKFFLEYSKLEKDDIIKDLKRSIKKSKEFQLFREPSRYTLIKMKEGAKEIEKATNELQQNMLYELKKCNKFKERIIKYNEQIKVIKKNIDILKNNNKIEDSESNISIENNIEIIEKPEFYKGKMNLKNSMNVELINGFGFKGRSKKFQEDNKSEPGSEDRKKTKKEKEKNGTRLIPEFEKVEDLFEISDVELDKANMIYDELNSDEEIVFFSKIKQPIKLTEFHFDDVKKEIPEINLDQIEYNKLKVIKEDDLYSIQRRKYKSQNIDNNIKELKKDIEKIEQQINLIKEKEKIMKDYIDKVKNKYLALRKFTKKNTSVHNKKIKFIKKSLLYKGGENIKEEASDEDDIDNDGFGSDYENEQNEEEDFGKGKQSVFVGPGAGETNETDGKQFGGWGGNLGKSVNDFMFKNKLRDKLKKPRAKSK